MWAKTLLALEANLGWLNEGGTVIVQIFPKEFQPMQLQTLQITDERKYGSTLLVFYESMREDPALP
jgi:16S rRNA G966 N2-methylase RsmD